jgi:hypothetical protein
LRVCGSNDSKKCTYAPCETVPTLAPFRCLCDLPVPFSEAWHRLKVVEQRRQSIPCSCLNDSCIPVHGGRCVGLSRAND